MASRAVELITRADMRAAEAQAKAWADGKTDDQARTEYLQTRSDYLQGVVMLLVEEVEKLRATVKPHPIYSFVTKLNDVPVVIDYEPTEDGACLGKAYLQTPVLDAHHDASVFCATNCVTWQVEADRHLRNLKREQRDEARIERAIDNRLRAVA